MKTKKSESESSNNFNSDKKLKPIFLGIGTAIVLYIILGAVTAIVPNRFFTRMTPVGLLEHSSLITTSLLLGTYIGLAYYDKSTRNNKLCNTSATTGGIFGFLTFGCSICNKILVFFLGVAGVFTYFEPIRPFLGILSIGLLGFAVLTKARNVFKANRIIKMSRKITFIVILILFSSTTFANGGCIKIADEVFVQLSSSPLVPVVNEQVSYLISFGNKDGLVNKEINGKLKIVKKEETIFTKDFKVKDGILELKYTFKNTGLHEIFLEFEINGKKYAPEDFLIEVKEEKQDFNFLSLIIGILIGIILMKLIKNKNKMKKRIFLIIFVMILLSTLVSAQELPIGLQRLKQYEQQLASSITFLLAFFAGLISMTSPCGIALLPTFFSIAFKDRKRAVLMTSAFSLGLLIAFTIFGLIAGFLGNFFNTYKLTFAVISGFILIFFGILLFLNVGFTIFNFKLDYSNQKSFFSTAILGFFFGVGWTPCVGPILVGILVLAANTATVLNGALMLIFYGIGIVAPLIVLAYFSDRYDWANSKLLRGREITFNLLNKKITTHTYNIIGGIFLLAIGLLMVIFKGTFFFQTELPKIVPWSMSFWGYLNERALESKIFSSTTGNVLGVVVVLLIIVFVVWYLNQTKKGEINEPNKPL